MRIIKDVLREVYPGANMKFVVLSRPLADRVYDEPFANISITDPEKQKIDLAVENNRKAVLSLQFHDADELECGYDIITKDQAKEIIDFVNEWKDKVNLFVVNCEAGLCRSAGIAAALSYWLNGEDKFFFDTYLPNKTVYRYVLNAANDAS